MQVLSDVTLLNLLSSTTGACLEYFLNNDLLTHLERLCEADRPHGIKGELPWIE